jgi:Zn-finger nucleic acid-binding protein
MKCPVCRIDMIAVEYRKIELDYCVRCSGVWFDSGEIELLLDTIKGEGSGFSGMGLTGLEETESTEKKRRCPICNQKMKKMTIGEEPKVLIDGCPRGDGLWFDGGELQQVITQVARLPSEKTESQEIISFLGDIFKAGDRSHSGT